ncbi:MAG TPA: M20/M25/M40 family metallo-hydrolase [Blastocatellia bacterium]
MISHNRRIAALAAICLMFLSSFAFAQEVDGASKARISTPEEIRSEFDSVPCRNRDRLKTVKALFEKMGAKPEEIAIEKARSAENLVIRKAAAEDSPEKIVIGAHYDKVPDGCGAIDNWTGIVALAHIYRSVKDLPFKKNVIFAAFGKEEEGLVGSSGMAAGIKKEQAAEYCAMINIDTIGMGVPATLDNVSSRKLIDFTVALAKGMNFPFTNMTINGASSDSASFIGRKIPAVTIHALNNDWRRILHSSNDRPEKINHDSVYVGYRVALALLVRVDSADCQAFREMKEKK